MNDITSILVSIAFGIGAGLVYAYFYIQSKSRVLSILQKAPSNKDLIIIYGGTFARILFVGALIYFLLLYQSIHFILTIGCFLVSFWCIIFFKKVY